MDTQQRKKYKILVIGDACLDIYYFGTCDRLSPEAPVPVYERKSVETRKGMCLNVAANLRSMGHEVHVDKNREIIKKIRIVDERSGQHILRVDEEPEITAIDVRKYSSKRNDLSFYDAMVISDYNKGYIPQGLVADIIENARKIDIPIFVDSKKKDLSSFDGCIIKINEKERANITSLPSQYELITTLGPKGCSWRNKTFSTKKVDVHDVCGAGDVFMSGLVHMYLTTNKNMEASIKFANKCAAESVSKFGTCVIKLSEVR
jgi:D-beta-D-heptose 7-phosphate kinase/D-beta-D-heptose 1-phosphate adenosyltransferase